MAQTWLSGLLGGNAAPDRAALAQVIADAAPHARVITRAGSGKGLVVVCANAIYGRLAQSCGQPERVSPLELASQVQAALERLSRRVPASGAVTDQVTLRRADGAELWLAVSVMVRPDEPSELIWDLADITHEHHALMDMAVQRDALAGFLDNAPVGLYSIAPDGHFLFANRTFSAWLGLSPDALTGGALKLNDVLLPADESGTGTGTGSGRAITPDWEGGEAKLSPPGTAHGSAAEPLRLVGVSQTPVPGPDGHVARYSAVVHDLSRELRVRGTLRPVEAEFRRFFDQAPIGILVLDAAGSIIEGNAAFGVLCGRHDWPGQRLAAVVREEDGAELNRHLMAVRRNEAVTRPLEVRFPGQDAARPRIAELFAASLDAGADSQATQLVYLVDTTHQRNLQQQFNQSQKMQAVGQLAGGIAHDFNNLLTAMIGFCDLLLQRHQPGDQSFADIMQVKQNANRAANLVRQLLAFSRQQTLMPKVLDVTDVLADLRNLIGRLIGETIQLRLVHGRDLGLVRVDQGQLEQVIINLAVNARDAMLQGTGASGSGGGELRIRTAYWRPQQPSLTLGGEMMPPGDYVLIEVSDSGHGIAPENLAKIFDPFFTTKAVGAGTGLGLSTVYGIIKQTGGFIQVESEVGQGAIFRIFLPRHEPSATERSAAREDSPAVAAPDLTGQGLVLLVEDEDAVRAFATRALRNKGYTVIEANSGEQALSLPEEQLDRVEVLVTDVVMPNMDGPTLAEHMRQRRPDLKILFISGYAEDALRRSLANADNVSFLPKPFSLSQLAGKLKDVMG
ncbi:response regulator [Ferrovibrio sp.]|uniref:hybrid sensor histidine kinase/response regulator n=1 Tax=Ferrovibrio sp. TaxID=1917215 RepID=UPI003D1448FC